MPVDARQPGIRGYWSAYNPMSASLEIEQESLRHMIRVLDRTTKTICSKGGGYTAGFGRREQPPAASLRKHGAQPESLPDDVFLLLSGPSATEVLRNSTRASSSSGVHA